MALGKRGSINHGSNSAKSKRIDKLQVIKQYQIELLNDKSNVNHIIKLYHFMTLPSDNTDNMGLMLASISVLSHVYIKYRGSGDFQSNHNDTDAIIKYKSWLNKQYNKFIDQSIRILHDCTNEQIQNTVIDLLCDDFTAQTHQDEHILQHTPNSLYTLIQHVLLTENLYPSSITVLTSYIQSYNDVRYHVLTYLQSIVQYSAKQWKRVADKYNVTGSHSDNNKTLRQLVSHHLCHILASYHPINSNQYEDKSNLCQCYTDITDDQYKQQLSDTWLSYLCNDQIDNSHETYAYTLSIMHNTILPSITTPLLLCDYLTDSYNIGGDTAVLALHGLLDLIQKHNLDYPNFYTMLYKLCGDVHIYHSQYRVTFYKLLHTFLTSRYIPNYMIAAFVKRLARIALITSAPSTYYIVALTHSILQRHKSIRFMLYGRNTAKSNDINTLLQQHHQHVSQAKIYDIKPATTESAAIASTDSELDSDDEDTYNDSHNDKTAELPEIDLDAIIAKASTGDKSTDVAVGDNKQLSDAQLLSLKNGFEGADPFDNTTDDMKLSNALYSSLWEISTLCHHYIGAVATLAKSLIDDQINKLPIEIDDYIDCTYTKLFDSASQYKKSQKPHINHTAPQQLFDTTKNLFNDIFT